MIIISVSNIASAKILICLEDMILIRLEKKRRSNTRSFVNCTCSFSLHLI